MSEVKDTIAKYIESRDFIKAEEKRLKEHLAPYKAFMTAAEDFLMGQCNSLGLESIKAETGTAYKKKKDRVGVASWDEFMDFIADTMSCEIMAFFLAKGAGAVMTAENLKEALLGCTPWGFFTKSITKEAVKEYMEENEGRLPAGIKYEQWVAITVNRPKTKTIKED